MSNKDEQPFVDITESSDEDMDLSFPEDIFPEVPFEDMSDMSEMLSVDSPQEQAEIGTDLINLGSQAAQELDNLRLPPHSIEAEQSVLGGLLLNNLANEQVGDVLTEEDYYRHHHRII